MPISSQADRTANVCAAVLLAASVLVSLFWVFRVPMFQCPDEDNHYDYALTLAGIGRPITSAEGDTAPDTHPVLQHLMRSSNAFSIRFDRLARVAAGYGSAAVFEHIDATTPRFTPPARGANLSPVPYISKLYPIVYYGSLAFLLTAARAFGHGSATFVFFSARVFSVALMAVALAFAWPLLVAMCGRPLRALPLFACTALLPLVPQIGACVQPDNMSFALVTAGLYFAHRWLANTGDRRYAVALGGTLALLAGVKRQYFLAVFVALGLAMASRYLSHPLERRRIRAAAASFFGLSAAMYLATRSLMGGPPDAHPMCPGTLTDTIAAVFESNSPASLPQRVWEGLSSQYTSAFTGGQAMWTYWIAFGSFGNEMTIVNQRFTSVIFHAIMGVTQVTCALVAFRILSVWARLVRVARLASWRKSLAVAAGNVPVNAYFVFIAVLLAYEASVGGVIAIQGRYWLPFVPVAWYVATQIAPRALRRGYGRAFSKILVTASLAFCAIATLYVPHSLALRYYVAAPPEPALETLVSIEPEGDAARTDLGAVRRGDVLRLAGIAEDLRSPGPVQSVNVRIDNRFDVAAQRRQRPDYACANTFAPLRNAGYFAVIPTGQLSAGRHSLDFWVTVPWSSRPIDTGRRASFTVAS